MVDFFYNFILTFVEFFRLLFFHPFGQGMIFGTVFCISTGYINNKNFTIEDTLSFLFCEIRNYNPIFEDDYNEVR